MTAEGAERRFLAMRRIQRARWSIGCGPRLDIPAAAWFALAIRLRAALGDDGSWREATAIGWVTCLRRGLHVGQDVLRQAARHVGRDSARLCSIGQ